VSEDAHPGQAREVDDVRQLLAVDGSSLAHRAWHSTRDDERADREGTVTAAFISMIATTWQHGPYGALLVAFDHPVNHRRRDFPEYKAQRASTPDDLRAALDGTLEHLTAAGVAVRREEGVEADDLLAAASDDARSRTWSCDLLSSDRDLIALVGGDVRLLRPRQRFTDLAIEDEEQVRVTYGVDPWHYIDLAALRGDVSDGLTGAPGIGPARAARLVRDHGSVADIYRALPDLPPALARSLRQGREDVERNLLLMSPLPHLDVDLDDAVARGAPLEALADLVDSLGFPGAARRVRRVLDGGRSGADVGDGDRAGATGAARMPPIPPPPDDRDVPR
jgi:DNA polymerase-1